MVHETPLSGARQKFHPPQNADTLKTPAAPHLLASSLCNLPSGDVCAVRVRLHVAARGWRSCPWWLPRDPGSDGLLERGVRYKQFQQVSDLHRG